MFQPMNADAKTKINPVDAGGACFKVVEYKPLLFGLTNYGENTIGTFCLED